MISTTDTKYAKVVVFGSEKEYVDAPISCYLQPRCANSVVPRIRCFGGARSTLITETTTSETGGKQTHT